jgi:integrase
VEPKEGEPRKRASWTYEPVTPANIVECEAKACERLKEKPELVAQLEALGRQRALTYKALVLTGLRLNELRSLAVGVVDLDGREPTAALAPENEKARRGAEIPLRSDLAVDLSQHIAERLQDAQRDAIRERRPVSARLPAETPLLPIPADAIRVLDLDLVAAGSAQRVRGTDRKGMPCWKIDKRDKRGRTFDIHAFRTTFNSLLAAASIPLTTRRILMRHAAEGVTDEHYADVKLIDLRGALDQLPALPLDGQLEPQAQSATGTDHATADRECSPASVFSHNYCNLQAACRYHLPKGG